jgi:PAS domain S-box-containing protein
MRLFDRFLRLLGRLRMWHQFTLLGLFVVTAPIVSTSLRFLHDGQRILTEHEVIDLSDDGNLRVTEFREEFDYLTRDVATDARALAQALAGSPVTDSPQAAQAALTRIAHGWEKTVPHPGDRPETVAQVRHRFFGGTLVQLFAVTLTPDAADRSPRVRVVATVGPDGRPALLAPVDPVVMETMRDLALRTTREVPTYVSDPHLQPAEADRPARCVVAVGWPARWVDRRAADLLVVVIDFSRYVSNRARSSPRHQFLVTRADGTLLVHPDPDLVARGVKVQDAVPWAYPDRAFADGSEDPTARDARHARMVREGGVRLPGVAIPTLAHVYRKGQFGGVLEDLLGDRTDERLADVNRRLAAEGRGDPRFRFGELTPTNSYIELSHPDQARVEHASKVVDDWWKAARGEKARVSWIDPLKCQTFQGQLTHLRMDENDEAEPPRLIVAASLEELHEDIDTQFTRIVWNWVLPTVGIAALLTVMLVVVLTRSLRRLAASAEKLSDPTAPVEVAGGGCREVTLLAGSLRDMATRLRDDAARFQTILRAAGEGIVVASGDGSIEEANRAAAKMFGYDRPEDLIGRRVNDLIADPVPEVDQPADPLGSSSASVSRGSPYFDAVRGVRKDGSSFWLEVTLRPVALRDRQVVTCVFRDVSQKKAAEEQIKGMNEELESRVRLRTAELAETNTKLEVALRQAEAAGRAKDTFVANMSHELRQPLHIVIGFTEALREEAADSEREELVPDLNKILAAARHLLDLINDLLDLAKISSGRMELAVAPFDLNKLVRDVRTLVAPLAEKNQNVFLTDAPDDLGEMTADERRVRQILINLLSNAFKFTAQGKVTLRVRRVEETGRDWVEFAVSDTGKGLTPDQVGRLFQRFYQADPTTTREHGGTGLGLAITQSFNDLLGGQPIRVTSVPGRGSEFVVRLPSEVRPDAGKPQPRHTPIEVPALADGDSAVTRVPVGGTVLVIDDDPAVLELMGRFLGKEGFHVVPATTGPDGLRLAKQLRPVAITLDVMMPGTDGWAVLADLKADPMTCDIPVVLLTIVDDRGRGYALGAADYLTKPIDWQRLGAILRRYHSPGRPAPVLVVDDDPECRELVRRNLEAEGWRVTEAADGEAGLRMVAADPPALVLLDLMMPGVDGFGFLNEFPKRFPGSRTPVIVLTAKDLTDDDHTRLNGRVARILAKGDLSRLEELIALVRRHVRHGKARAATATHSPSPLGGEGTRGDGSDAQAVDRG